MARIADVEGGREKAPELRKQLRMRHMTMISLGGVIGAGLFVGSGAVISTVGPASFISYAIAGLIIVMVMRMLGEMAVASPQIGSFAEYARISLGDWAGFAVGWLYWYFWVIVLAVEAQAGALIIQGLFDLSSQYQWLISLVLMLLLTGTNLFSVGSYGEFEFWFASIKVAAIIGFIALGALYVLGLWPGASLDFSNLTAHGGFLPHGALVMFAGVTTLIFSFVGAEIVTLAAAESREPERSVARATNSVIWRVMLFYVLSIFLIVTIVPWNDPALEPRGQTRGPFVAALEQINFPGAATIMSVVVLVAVLSCLNSGLYTCSRMLNAIARRGDAPKAFLRVNGRGVPVWSILISTAVGYLSVIAAFYAPNAVFTFLLNTSGAVALFVYLLIAISELRLRRRIERENPERLAIKMWLYPYLTWLTIGVFVVVIVAVGINADTRSQLLLTLLSIGVVLVAYALTWYFGKRKGESGPSRMPVDR